MSLPAPLSSPATATSLLQAADDLLAWQLATAPGQLPRLDASRLRQGLDGFAAHYLGTYRQLSPAQPWPALMDQACEALLAELAGMAMAPTPDPGSPQPACLGPLAWGIAALTRDPAVHWDEETALDVTVRYWQKARSTALPVPQDFGEFYRAVEFAGLQQQLTALGKLARNADRTATPAALTRLVQGAHAAAGRYRELKALARVIEQAEGLPPTSGYAFGRM